LLDSSYFFQTVQGYGLQLPCTIEASVNSKFETIKVEKEGVWYKSSESFDQGEEADVDVEMLKKELESLELLRKLEPDNKCEFLVHLLLICYSLLLLLFFLYQTVF
jgi:hypothetical protein